MKTALATILIGLALCASSVAQEPVRVFLTDSQSWASTYAPSRIEQVQNLSKYCPAVTVTADIEKADFVIVWVSISYEQTRWGGHEHEWAIFDPQKDVLGTGAEYHMKNAAKDICKKLESIKKPTK